MISLPTETNGTHRPSSPGETSRASSPDRPHGDDPTTDPPAEIEEQVPHDGSYSSLSLALQNEAERLFTQGQYGAAELKVRHLLELQHQAVGPQHEDFALGLSMLGELRFLQGDRVAAEGMFRRALAIREQVLGRSHPDTAVSLTCLAGILWHRELLDDAERYFREALAIRVEQLGPDDPETVQSRKELVRLLRHRGQWTAAQALIDESDGAAIEEQEAASTSTPNRLANDVIALSGDLARLGSSLALVARSMQASGTPPPEESVQALAECRRRFDALRVETLTRVAALEVPNPPQIEIETLEDLASVSDDLADAEHYRVEQERLRQTALAVLDRVLALTHRELPEFRPLLDSQVEAARLQEEIRSGHWLQLPDQAESLARGNHPFINLLIFVERRDVLSDQDWASLHQLVADSFGKPLAVAVSRGNLSEEQGIGATGVKTTARRPEPVPDHARLAQSAPAPPARAQVVVSTHSPSRGLISDLAVASLVPSMGTVIHLPTDSPAETEEAHRLLRVGQAPNIIERDHPTWDPPAPPVHSQPRRHSGPALIAGPLHRPSLFDPQDELNRLTEGPFGAFKPCDAPGPDQPGATSDLIQRARTLLRQPT